jgi:hypothetical protein
MSVNRYINYAKDLIENNAKKYSANNKITPEYFNKLYSEISSDLRKMAEMTGAPEVDDDTLFSYFEIARKEYLSINPINIESSSTLKKSGLKIWLTPEREKKIKWNYTDRYLRYLKSNDRSEAVIKEIDRSSQEILGNLGDPKRVDPYHIKGLVVGEVQSGKTGNFNAVINRSIDCGYKLVIVLSGIMEDLRNQTQDRIETEVVGEGKDFETQKIGTKGVGYFGRFGMMAESNVVQLESITSCKADFNKNLLDSDFSLSNPKILVCKKNEPVLKNLITWLHDYLGNDSSKHDIPLLVLDDEADNASLNNEGAKGREYASKINGHIRALLHLFHKKSYLGYTATPFANVLQDRNSESEKKWTINYKLDGTTEEKRLDQVPNLFPDDFIVLLNSPSNYIGAKQLFETLTPIENKALEKIPLISEVDDNDEHFPSRVHKESILGVANFQGQAQWDEKVGEFGQYLEFSNYNEYKKATRSSKPYDDFPKKIPESLIEAILCFILSIAVRDSRKPKQINSAFYEPHNTMLIHISRFTIWQNTTRDLIEDYIKGIKVQIENDDPRDPKSIYFKLNRIWYRQYAEIIESIKDYLPNGYVDDFMSPILFDSLEKYLPDAIKDIQVLAINSITKKKLIYPKNSQQKIIAIGGNRLSRGFTIRGLAINYFVRSTNYSDTLLQMGRWFGYRPGYLDCCKLFTTRDSVEKFNLTTRCIEELEGEFRKMEDVGKSPSSFVLKVKKHPSVLKITRPSILKNTTNVKWSYQDQLAMTTRFNIGKQKVERVWDIFKRYIAPKFDREENKNAKDFFRFPAIGAEIIDFLNLENNFDKTEISSMTKFIEICQKRGQLTDWTVAIKLNGNANKKSGKGVLTAKESNLPGDVTMAIRRGPKKHTQEDYRKQFREDFIFRAAGSSANIVSSSSDLQILLSDSEIASAESAFRIYKKQFFLNKNKAKNEEEAEELAKKVTIPERVYREKIKEHQGLLIIYAFDSYYSFKQEKGQEDDEFTKFVEDNNYDLDIPIIGYALGFPPLENDPGGEYVKGDYDLSEDEEYPEEDVQPEDLGLPEDFS